MEQTEKRRFFWDSRFANWLELKSDRLHNWVIDKRYPPVDWNAVSANKDLSEGYEYNYYDPAPMDPPKKAKKTPAKKRIKKT